MNSSIAVHTKCSLILLALFGAPCYADSESSFSGHIDLVTDYIFRGQSQTDEHGAIQGGLEWSGESGLSLGVWGSNVNFDSDAQAELDYYIGYGGSLTESVDYDIGYIYYSYVGESPLNYQELLFAVHVADLSVAINYSNSYLGDAGSSFYYLAADYALTLTNNFSLNCHLGFNKADEMDISFDGTGDDSYTDWAFTLNREMGALNLSLGYHGTTVGDGNPLADDRLVFAIGKSL